MQVDNVWQRLQVTDSMRDPYGKFGPHLSSASSAGVLLRARRTHKVGTPDEPLFSLLVVPPDDTPREEDQLSQ